MKKAGRFLFSLILPVFLAAGCADALALQKQTFTIELGKDIYGNPSLYLKDPEKYNTENMAVVCLEPSVVKKDNRFVSANQDYLVVGTYDFQLISGSQSADFKIKVKDTQAPTVTSNPSVVTVRQNSVINWQDVFGATDISGVTYDAPDGLTANRGTQNVIVKISDRYGNSTEKSITLNVE